MTAPFIPVSEPLLDGNELRYVTECITSGWVSSEGPFVTRFEKEFAASVNRKYGIGVANGTVALELALRSLNLSPGDEIILPSFTIISCILAVLRTDAMPVLVDSRADTWNMDVGQIEKAITPRTRAIMVVHTYGLPAEMEAIEALAAKHSLVIIEDAAEMHGGEYRGKPCGSFGKVSTFSFYANKLLTTGEGGMVVTDDDEINTRCRLLRNLAFQESKRFVHEDLGYNFRLTNIQAAVGVAQLERLSEHLQMKRAVANRYHHLLAELPQIQLPLARTPDAENVYWVFGLVLNDSVPFDAPEAMRRLRERGIGTRPFFFPLHEQPVFTKNNLFLKGSFPVAERLARRGFYIPLSPSLSESDQDRVVSELTALVRSPS